MRVVTAAASWFLRAPTDVDELTALALAARDGNEVAAGELARLTYRDVWRFCAYLDDFDSADDLTQEVYVRALRALPRYRGDSSARTWLLAIARRTVADAVRSRRRRRRLAQRVPPVERVDHHGAGGIELHDLVVNLAPERREAFVLTQVVGLPYADAAQICRCPIGTVRSRVARARADLMSELQRAETA